MIDRQSSGIGCDECREIYKLRNKNPPCEGCRPELHQNNVETWDVYQVACMSEMGITVSDVISAAKEMGIDDVLEVLFKISQFVYEIRSLRNSSKEATVEDAKNVFHGSKR